MTNYKSHPWPTDGATKKQLDRVADKLNNRVDRLRRRVQELEVHAVRIVDRLTKFQEVLGWSADTNSELSEEEE